MANSPKYHELTERIVNTAHPWGDFDKADRIIRSYLEASLGKLLTKGLSPWAEEIQDALGLGDVEAEKCLHGKPFSYKCYECEGWKVKADISPKEAPKQEFGCKHMANVSQLIFHYKDRTAFDELKNPFFCPICGVPRPKEKSREEKVIEVLKDAYHSGAHDSINFMAMAKNVVEWMEDNKWRKT